jgi:protein TonB
MSNPRARQSITAWSWSDPGVRASLPVSRVPGGRIRAPFAASAALHLFVLALFLLRIVPFGTPVKDANPPLAKVELVVQDTPTVGDGPREKAEKPEPKAAPQAPPTAKATPEAKAAAAPTPPLPALPAADKPDQVTLPKTAQTAAAAAQARPTPPTPPSHAAPAVRLGMGGIAGTGLVTGPDVIPAGPDSTVHNIPPAYPEAAAMLHEQGRVMLLVHVAPDGRTAAVDVVESSGYLLLDRAAHDAVAKWRFRPATSNGAPVASEMPIEINFDLESKRAR